MSELITVLISLVLGFLVGGLTMGIIFVRIGDQLERMEVLKKWYEENQEKIKEMGDDRKCL